MNNEYQSNMMYCTSCGNQISRQAYVCPKCGILIGNQPKVEKRVTPNMNGGSFCTNCGATTSINQHVCTKCGVLLNHKHNDIYASFGQRLGAYLIDYIILLPVVIIIQYFTGVYAELANQIQMQYYNANYYSVSYYSRAMLVNSLIALIFIIYNAVMESSKLQGSFGKKFAKIKVTDYDGNRISFGKALLRGIGKYFSGLIIIGYLMPFFTEKKQALHDFMASTLVVKK